MRSLDTIVCGNADVGRPVQFCLEETAGVVWIRRRLCAG